MFVFSIVASGVISTLCLGLDVVIGLPQEIKTLVLGLSLSQLIAAMFHYNKDT